MLNAKREFGDLVVKVTNVRHARWLYIRGVVTISVKKKFVKAIL